MSRLLTVFLLVTCLVTKAQKKDPQNMEVAPQNTSCQGLGDSYPSLDAAVKAIEGAKYYFEQEFTTTREKSFQAARFLSCDFEKGYLVVTYDNNKQIYTGVTQEFWDRFLASGDPDGFYEKEIQKLAQIKVLPNSE